MVNQDDVDWEAFVRSEEWLYKLKPAIEAMRQDAYAALLKATPETLSLLQGKVTAYTEVVEEPEKRAKTALFNRKRAEERKAKEIAENEDKRPAWLRNAGNRIRRATTRSHS